MRRFILLFSLLAMTISLPGQTLHELEGKRVGFLGDSMTDPKNKAADDKYWAVLAREDGVKPEVFARSGYMWDKMYDKANEMRDSVGDNLDAIVIFCGTNDFNHNREIGEFYTERMDSTNSNGNMVKRKHREWNLDPGNMAGSMNRALQFLKTNYPDVPIMIMTPIHRGYAKFGERNVQPDEDFANDLGLYIEDYVAAIRLGAMYWSVPVVDLFAESGILPNLPSNDKYIAKPDTDRLHPSNEGHKRIARMLRRKLAEVL